MSDPAIPYHNNLKYCQLLSVRLVQVIALLFQTFELPQYKVASLDRRREWLVLSISVISLTINMTPADHSHSRLAVLCVLVFYHVSLAWSQSCSDNFTVSYQYDNFDESIEASADTKYCSMLPNKQCCECSQAVYICDGLDAALSDFKQTRPNGSAIQFSVTLRSSSNGKLVLDLNNSYSFNIDYMQIRAIDGDVTINLQQC